MGVNARRVFNFDGSLRRYFVGKCYAYIQSYMHWYGHFQNTILKRKEQFQSAFMQPQITMYSKFLIGIFILTAQTAYFQQKLEQEVYFCEQSSCTKTRINPICIKKIYRIYLSYRTLNTINEIFDTIIPASLLIYVVLWFKHTRIKRNFQI